MFFELRFEIEAPVAARHEAPGLHELGQHFRPQTALRITFQPLLYGLDQVVDGAIVFDVLGCDTTSQISGAPQEFPWQRWCVGLGGFGERERHRLRRPQPFGERHTRPESSWQSAIAPPQQGPGPLGLVLDESELHHLRLWCRRCRRSWRGREERAWCVVHHDLGNDTIGAVDRINGLDPFAHLDRRPLAGGVRIIYGSQRGCGISTAGLAVTPHGGNFLQRAAMIADRLWIDPESPGDLAIRPHRPLEIPQIGQDRSPFVGGGKSIAVPTVRLARMQNGVPARALADLHLDLGSVEVAVCTDAMKSIGEQQFAVDLIVLAAAPTRN
jgi:hypothetical protein